MNLILLGPPGSGKGTQAFALKKMLDVEHLSTGDLFRAAIKNETAVGVMVKSYLDEGLLVPDDVTSRLIRETLVDLERDFMLDGFPRTVAQAESLEEMSRELDFPIDAVLNFQVEEKLLVERLTGRRICRNCGASYHLRYNSPKEKGICDLCGGELYQRSDDNKESVVTRLQEYKQKTQPLVDFYEEKGILLNVGACSTIEECTKEIIGLLGIDND